MMSRTTNALFLLLLAACARTPTSLERQVMDMASERIGAASQAHPINCISHDQRRYLDGPVRSVLGDTAWFAEGNARYAFFTMDGATPAFAGRATIQSGSSPNNAVWLIEHYNGHEYDRTGTCTEKSIYAGNGNHDTVCR
jgi:hypothetical protein